MKQNEKKIIGSVLVQGAGISGIQASLDLANSGFKVYLVERSASIGGMMSHLDKTFPTGDCATCIVSPKLVECSRNLNIEIHTLSEVRNISGEPGNFSVSISKSPRYLNEKICNDCGDCTNACPVEINDKFNRNLGTRKAVQKYYSQAVPNKPYIMKLGHSPCKVKCPANINVQGYVQLIKKKKYLKAADLIRQRNPFASVCGRVCPAPCEDACMRSEVDSAIAIRQLKRFASDFEYQMIRDGELRMPEWKIPNVGAKKVAIIGAGPSGLTAASDLADEGFAVTVYESKPVAGGMLYWGIPQYRLPKDILEFEVELIKRKGVNIILNCSIGKDKVFDELLKENDAVYISTGAHISRKLGIEGEDKEGVLYGVEFLRQIGDPDNKPVVKENVAVIGGGNVAVDVARTALRLGAKRVELISLEQRDEMPAYKDEIMATLQEGIIIRNGWGPKKIFGNGKVMGIVLKKCTSVFNPDGRFNPVYDENDTINIDADQLIAAIGQTFDEKFTGHTGVILDRGRFKADPITLETSINGVFAGGDGASGPASVIEAVAAGKRTAESIGRHLNGADLRPDRFESTLKPVPEELLPSTVNVKKKNRSQAVELGVNKRENNFNEIESAFSEENAIAEAERCLNCALCSECMECVAACEKNAMDHTMKEQTVELETGSIILTPGFKEFDASKKGEYGFDRYTNVLTSVQFERMLSAAGPYGGHVLRKDNGNEAKRIAWIQCVGSRDDKNEYCSSICCMASTKQALVAKEHVADFHGTIFYMDIRAFGKDFDQYYERARNSGSIEYIRSMPSRIYEMPGTKNLRIRYLNDKFEQEEMEFDLVVLSVGLDSKEISAKISSLGIELNDYNFCTTDRFDPLTTSRPGIFAAGTFQEPKDIPETVTQASAAASMSMELLARGRNTLISKKTYPAEHDITDEEPRIGVFVCHCGINIASVIDVEKVTEAIAKEPGVVFASHTMYTCSDSSLSNIKTVIEENRLNRIVVASCTPRTHEPLFRDTMQEAGLNPYLFEMANIRDQCSWVHSSDPEAATEKAADLVRMAIARSRLLVPLEGETISVNQTGLVIGAGLAGMTAALSLADQGFKVHLVEQAERPGGNLLNLYETLEHGDVRQLSDKLIKRIESHQKIKLYISTEVESVSGHIGNFTVRLNQNSEKFDVACGAIIVATGANQSVTSDYLYGKSRNVLTQIELERLLNENKMQKDIRNIVMIQCVGSRNKEHAYCSRVCCSMAVQNALALERKNPDAKVFVLYRDMRTYGFRELYYKKARNTGVLFMRYDENHPPVVTDDNGLKIKFKSPDFPEEIEIETDMLALSTGITALADNKRIADMLKVPLNGDGFYVEAHLKLRPVEFTTEGIYLCGLAHSPKFIDENISQARAAASRAATLLSKTKLTAGAQVSYVDQKKCVSCMTCVKACPYGAPATNKDNKAEITAAKCMGCGICASECPARAIQLGHFESRQFNSMLDALFIAQAARRK